MPSRHSISEAGDGPASSAALDQPRLRIWQISRPAPNLRPRQATRRRMATFALDRRASAHLRGRSGCLRLKQRTSLPLWRADRRPRAGRPRARSPGRSHRRRPPGAPCRRRPMTTRGWGPGPMLPGQSRARPPGRPRSNHTRRREGLPNRLVPPMAPAGRPSQKPVLARSQPRPRPVCTATTSCRLNRRAAFASASASR
jgi:hypothetical protein